MKREGDTVVSFDNAEHVGLDVADQQWGKLYPRAVACLEDDFEALTTRLRFPKEHWPRVRHSNFIERRRLADLLAPGDTPRTTVPLCSVRGEGGPPAPRTDPPAIYETTGFRFSSTSSHVA